MVVSVIVIAVSVIGCSKTRQTGLSAYEREIIANEPTHRSIGDSGLRAHSAIRAQSYNKDDRIQAARCCQIGYLMGSWTRTFFNVQSPKERALIAEEVKQVASDIGLTLSPPLSTAKDYPAANSLSSGYALSLDTKLKQKCFALGILVGKAKINYDPCGRLMSEKLIPSERTHAKQSFDMLVQETEAIGVSLDLINEIYEIRLRALEAGTYAEIKIPTDYVHPWFQRVMKYIARE